MSNDIRRLIRMVCVCVVAFVGPAVTTYALDTSNTLMTIDAMVMDHQGLFRAANPADGYNTFSFGPFGSAAGALGKYKSFYFVTTGVGDKGISNNARLHSDTPEHWTGSAYQIPDRSSAPFDITS